jgi:hypothetical protein
VLEAGLGGWLWYYAEWQGATMRTGPLPRGQNILSHLKVPNG